MKKINNRWVDNNNNSWSGVLSKAKASEYSNSLINCSDCSNCYNCSGCSNCSYCNDCNDCSYCNYCRDCGYCNDCSYCRDCYNCNCCRDCSYCSYCRDYKQNPNRYTTAPIGSRGAQTHIYWTSKSDIQIVCGCFKGSLKQFSSRILNTYPDKQHKHRIEYDKVIREIKYLTKRGNTK